MKKKKSDRTLNLTIRVSPDERARLDRLAELERQSITTIIMRAVEFMEANLADITGSHAKEVRRIYGDE